MTTCVYDRRTKLIVADTQNTDRAGGIYRTNKIERLKDGRYFLGSGNCYTIGAAKRWADVHFDHKKRPDEFAVLFEQPDEYGFSCLIISPDGATVWILDDEMEPLLMQDEYMAVGSGAAYALAAMDAGASATQALDIACNRDSSTSHPVNAVQL